MVRIKTFDLTREIMILLLFAIVVILGAVMKYSSSKRHALKIYLNAPENIEDRQSARLLASLILYMYSFKKETEL